MNITAKAQSLAPSYYYLPDDGAIYRCSECGEQKKHDQMIKPFCPDGKSRMAICVDCVCEDWLAKAQEIKY